MNGAREEMRIVQGLGLLEFWIDQRRRWAFGALPLGLGAAACAVCCAVPLFAGLGLSSIATVTAFVTQQWAEIITNGMEIRLHRGAARAATSLMFGERCR